MSNTPNETPASEGVKKYRSAMFIQSDIDRASDDVLLNHADPYSPQDRLYFARQVADRLRDWAAEEELKMRDKAQGVRA